MTHITVVIPAYNAGAFLEATLRSVEKQDYPHFDVILIDGASTDQTVEVARRFPFVGTIVSEPDRGQLDALQKGLRLAGGDIIYWLNADDIAMPGAFRAAAEAFKDPKVDFVFSDDFAFREPDELWVGPTIRGMNYLDHLLFYRQLYSECVYWRREVTRYLDDEYLRLRIYTDYAFLLNMRRGRRGKWLPKRLGAFRDRPGQVSKSYPEKKKEEYGWIRQKERAAFGLPETWFPLVKGLYFPIFYVRQVLYVQAERGLRRLCRRIDGDRTRKKLATWFFNDWLAN
jgi:glycosyltransferase involved in cell wall biosynthesis